MVGGRTGRWLVLDSRTRETLQDHQVIIAILIKIITITITTT